MVIIHIQLYWRPEPHDKSLPGLVLIIWFLPFCSSIHHFTRQLVELLVSAASSSRISEIPDTQVNLLNPVINPIIIPVVPRRVMCRGSRPRPACVGEFRVVGIRPEILVLWHGRSNGRVRLVVVASITRVHPAHGRLVVGMWQGVGVGRVAVAVGGVDAGLLYSVAVPVEVVWVGVCWEDVGVV